MSTKDFCFSSTKEKQQFFGTFSTSFGGSSARYDNFNLNNQNQKCSKIEFLQSSKNISTENNNRQKQNNFGKKRYMLKNCSHLKCKLDSSNFYQSKIDTHFSSSKPLNLLKKVEEQNQWKKEGKNYSNATKSKNNNSTLSLHISAYENSIVNCDAVQFKQQQQNPVHKGWKNLQNFTSKIQSSFEYPRQQEDCKNEPEIMQFKASQKLLDPNNQVKAKKASKETHILPTTDRAFQLNVEPSNRIVFMGDWMKELSTSIKITNKSDSRQAYKVKCTRNDLFRIRPPSGILDFNASIDVQLSFKPTGNEPESDKHHVGIYHIPAPEGATASGAWAEHYGPPQGEKRLKICFEKTD